MEQVKALILSTSDCIYIEEKIKEGYSFKNVIMDKLGIVFETVQHIELPSDYWYLVNEFKINQERIMQ